MAICGGTSFAHVAGKWVDVGEALYELWPGMSLPSLPSGYRWVYVSSGWVSQFYKKQRWVDPVWTCNKCGATYSTKPASCTNEIGNSTPHGYFTASNLPTAPIALGQVLSISVAVSGRGPYMSHYSVSGDGVASSTNILLRHYEGGSISVVVSSNPIYQGKTKTWRVVSSATGSDSFSFSVTFKSAVPEPTKILTTLTLQVDNPNPTVGQSVTFSVWLNRADTGAGVANKPITFKGTPADITRYTNVGGYAYTTQKYTSVGTRTVTAEFAGDSVYEGCESEDAFEAENLEGGEL